MKHKGLLKSLIVFSFILILFSFASYAWIIATFKSDPIIVESGTLKLSAQLLEAKDSNRDGVLDTGPVYEEITTGFMVFANVIPGQIYTYRISVLNTGSVDGYLTIKVNDITPSNPALFNLLQMNYYNPIEDETIDLDLTQSTYTLFDDLLVASNTEYILDFTIYIKPTINNNLHDEYISIGHFEIILNQIENQ